MSASQSGQAPSPPPPDIPNITTVEECLEAHQQSQSHLLAAVNLLSSIPPLPVDPITRASISSSNALTLKNALADRMPKLIDGYNVLLHATSSLTKGLVQSQAALDFLLASQEDPESSGPPRKKTRTSRQSGSPEKGQRDKELTSLVRYVFKSLVGMEHSSGARRIDPGPGILKEHQWPEPTESGFEEVTVGDGTTVTYHRPTWRNSRAAKVFFDAISSTIETSHDTEWKKFGASEVNAAARKYYNSVGSSVRAATDSDAGEAKRRKDRSNRRSQRILRTLDARTKHFDSSPLALCREAEFFRQSVLLADVIPEQLSDDEEEILRKSDTMDERAVLRGRAAGKSSTVGEMHHRKERFWLSKLVRHAGAVLDAHAASVNRGSSSSASSSARSSTTSARASTFPLPRRLWSEGNASLPTICPKLPDGSVSPDAVGSPLPVSCVASAEKTKNLAFASSLFEDVLPVGEEMLRPAFSDILKEPQWAGLMETVQRQLRTPRWLADDELVLKTEDLRKGAVVDWSDESDVESEGGGELAGVENLQTLLNSMIAS